MRQVGGEISRCRERRVEDEDAAPLRDDPAGSLAFFHNEGRL